MGGAPPVPPSFELGGTGGGRGPDGEGPLELIALRQASSRYAMPSGGGGRSEPPEHRSVRLAALGRSPKEGVPPLGRPSPKTSAACLPPHPSRRRWCAPRLQPISAGGTDDL